MRILTTFLALLFKKENEKENSQHYTRHMHVKSHREQRLKEKEHVLFVLISDYLPGEEERLIQAVEDVDDDVVVGYRVYIRPRELPIDQDTLYPNTRTINPILSSVPNHSKINSMYFLTVLGSNFQNNFPNVVSKITTALEKFYETEPKGELINGILYEPVGGRPRDRCRRK